MSDHCPRCSPHAPCPTCAARVRAERDEARALVDGLAADLVAAEDLARERYRLAAQALKHGMRACERARAWARRWKRGAKHCRADGNVWWRQLCAVDRALTAAGVPTFGPPRPDGSRELWFAERRVAALAAARDAMRAVLVKLPRCAWHWDEAAYARGRLDRTDACGQLASHRVDAQWHVCERHHAMMTARNARDGLRGGTFEALGWYEAAKAALEGT